MKKNISIAIIVLVVLGLGWFLFKISPRQTQAPAGQNDFDVSNVQPQSQPNPASAQDYILGNQNAANTLVAYEDFECPACAAFDSTLTEIPSAFKDTKVVFRIFPLLQIHPNAAISAYAATAAGAQGKFWEYSKVLFEKQDEWAGLADPTQKFIEYAQAVGIANLDQFKSDISSQKYKDHIQQNLREALALNLQGTPSIFFNGKELRLGDLNSIKTQAETLYK